ncbi:WYL domain-containing protein [Paenibacillus sp. UNCCL117]|uniref:WYL domain-containing protein n=1 Tax=unclassified Paenibacillus TaxID=185978 RepID=UPI00088C3379|nr:MULTISPECIES: WYL domain-containing protein [unclassified Paenibacillus]SDE48400.1 WYL domain-containing protein [Paenibacillus sp. cl123]SFW66658.1 WYL domain-containing protein [Paenibacillus sp. UNCCL117]
MNLFEKIFNHQIISRLEDSGTFMITSHERAWLKTMLEHPAAADAFTAGTLDKLRSALVPDQVMDTSPHLIEKAGTMEKQVYHPLLRPLRRHIMNKTGIRITYEMKGGRVNTEHSGFPYKLEYSMVKREWYLLWYHIRHHAFMSTRLKKIHSVTSEPIESSAAESILKKIGKTLESRKTEAVIEIIRTYNEELSRILYVFSSFEKKVEYAADTDTYRVTVCLLGDEMEYLLSKIRFLGKRIRVVEGDYLKKRMLEASTKALERYGVVAGEEELTSSLVGE